MRKHMMNLRMSGFCNAGFAVVLFARAINSAAAQLKHCGS